jgi:2-phosphosulfolactate phosphatase
VPTRGRFSLSPLTYVTLAPATRIVLASPNGATCSRYARAVPYVFVGALLNAAAVAAAITQTLDLTHGAVTIIACGERWPTPSEDGALRFAIEDELGAGAILSYLNYSKSPEARTAEGAFMQLRPDLAEVLTECGSGRELHAKGWGADVDHCAQLNAYAAVPVMRDERLERYAPRA